jgi:hypothetical protein
VEEAIVIKNSGKVEIAIHNPTDEKTMAEESMASAAFSNSVRSTCLELPS